MRAAYIEGALRALKFDLGIKRVDVVTGSSGSLATLSYFISGQLGELPNIWTEYCTKPEFISVGNVLKGKPYLNLDWLIDDVMKNDVPLDVDAVMSSPTTMIVPATDALSGKAKYFTNRQKHDWFEVLRAGKAFPVGYNRNVKVGRRIYTDGGMVDPLPVDVGEMEGTVRIFILTKTTEYGQVTGTGARLGYGLVRPMLKTGTYKALLKKNETYHKRVTQIEKMAKKEHVLVRPSVKMKRLDNTQALVDKSMQMGRKDMLASKKVRKLIKKMKRDERAEFFFE